MERTCRGALDVPFKDLDPALYYLPNDPKEVNNLAFDPGYQEVASKMHRKLLNIVLGDNRIEVDWGDNRALGTTVFRNNFAPGADDKRLDL